MTETVYGFTDRAAYQEYLRRIATESMSVSDMHRLAVNLGAVVIRDVSQYEGELNAGTMATIRLPAYQLGPRGRRPARPWRMAWAVGAAVLVAAAVGWLLQ